MAIERLQKILSRAGVASRRKAEQMILQGKVTVNGRVVKKLGTKADASIDHIKVNGRLLRCQSRMMYYYLAYKPKKVITTLSDPQGRLTIADMLRLNRIKARVFPVGRLDWDAEGLLILTNDGGLANQIMHPGAHLSKVYRVKVMGFPADETLQSLRRGVVIDGRKSLPARVSCEKKGLNSMWLNISICEGRKNQLKKMLQQVGHPVCAIQRVAIGPLKLTGMEHGDIRPMTPRELRRLKKALTSSKT